MASLSQVNRHRMSDDIGAGVEPVKAAKAINNGDTEILNSSRCSDLTLMAAMSHEGFAVSLSDNGV